MRINRISIGVGSVVIAGCAWGVEREVINWMLLDLPPIVILDNGTPTIGTTDQRLRMLINQWPEVSHTFTVVNVPRAFLELDKPDTRSCYPMAIMTPERAARYYMTPFSVGHPHQLIVRKDKVSKLPRNSKGEVLPVALFDQKELRGLVNPSRSYSALIDALLARHADSKEIERVNPAQGNANLLQMVAKNRADYTIEYDHTFRFQLEKVAALNGGLALVSLPIAGMQIAVGGVACPKTAWGRSAIMKIDAIVSSLADEPGFRYPSNPWAADHLRQTYKSDIDAFYQDRAKPSESLRIQLKSTTTP